MTSTEYGFQTIAYRATLAASLLAALLVTAPDPADRDLRAAEVAVEGPAQVAPPQTRPADEQTPQQSDQPKERKRTRDGPPKDELLPNGRRLPA